ncbi:MAG: hypothetical protein V4506_17535 [Bacteroidota bacterium]
MTDSLFESLTILKDDANGSRMIYRIRKVVIRINTITPSHHHTE